jgi:hypothetical protein
MSEDTKTVELPKEARVVHLNINQETAEAGFQFLLTLSEATAVGVVAALHGALPALTEALTADTPEAKELRFKATDGALRGLATVFATTGTYALQRIAAAEKTPEPPGAHSTQ